MVKKKTLFIPKTLLGLVYMALMWSTEFTALLADDSYLLKSNQAGYQGLNINLYIQNISGNITYGVYHMSGNIITVSNAEELEKAFANATGGEVIELAPGDYGYVRLRFKSFDEKITIRGSEDGEAVFETLKLTCDQTEFYQAQKMDTFPVRERNRDANLEKLRMPSRRRNRRWNEPVLSAVKPFTVFWLCPRQKRNPRLHLVLRWSRVAGVKS